MATTDTAAQQLTDWDVTITLARRPPRPEPGDAQWERRPFTYTIPAVDREHAQRGAIDIGLAINKASGWRWKLTPAGRTVALATVAAARPTGIPSQQIRLEVARMLIENVDETVGEMAADIQILAHVIEHGTMPSRLPTVPVAEEQESTPAQLTGLRNDLASLLNRYSAENGSNTPDHLLADYLLGCLQVYNATLQERARWYGRMDVPGHGSVPYPELAETSAREEPQ